MRRRRGEARQLAHQRPRRRVDRLPRPRVPARARVQGQDPARQDRRGLARRADRGRVRAEGRSSPTAGSRSSRRSWPRCPPTASARRSRSPRSRACSRPRRSASSSSARSARPRPDGLSRRPSVDESDASAPSRSSIASSRTIPPPRCAGAMRSPRSATRFPPSLAAEAVGQLAAWAAMNALDFRVRPVAGLAGETRFGRAVRPRRHARPRGDDGERDRKRRRLPRPRARRGRAGAGARRTRSDRCCPRPTSTIPPRCAPTSSTLDDGRRAGRIASGGVDGARARDRRARRTGSARAARSRSPRDAPYFDDHFPRRPVYPATLLMDALGALAARTAGGGARVVGMQDVKVRAFMPPGETLAIVGGARRDEAAIAGRARGEDAGQAGRDRARAAREEP